MADAQLSTLDNDALDRLPAIIEARRQLPSFSEQANALQVTDEVSKIQANRLGQAIVAEKKAITAEHDKIVRATKEAHDIAVAKRRDELAPWDALGKLVKDKVDHWLIEEEHARQAATEKARLEAAEAARLEEQRRAMMAADAESKGIDPGLVVPRPAPVVMPAYAPPERTVRTQEGTVSEKMVWLCDVIEPEEVPWEYCTHTPSKTRLNQAVADGARDIPGCRIYRGVARSFR